MPSHRIVPTEKADHLPKRGKRFKRCSGRQFDPEIVEVFLRIPPLRWSELRAEILRMAPSMRVDHPVPAGGRGALRFCAKLDHCCVESGRSSTTNSVMASDSNG